MPRKYRAVKIRASVWPPEWWMQQDLWRGPVIPQYVETGEPVLTSDEDVAAAYEQPSRRGFQTLTEMRDYWEANRGRLMAEYGSDAVIGWWAYKQWG